jgi:uncharacterized protein involved in response to NO
MTEGGGSGDLAVLAAPFRAFFLIAALFALVAIPLWTWMYLAAPVLPGALDPRAWHIHEMLFGYLGAVLAGFLFTAIPNWTGRLPLRGVGLGLVVLLWLAGRAVVPVLPGTAAAAIVDCAFLVVIAGLAWREIIAGRNWRNIPICLLVALFALANILFHVLEASGLGERLGLAVAALLIGLVGGRIIPSFTRNWLAKRGATRLPAPFGMYDKLAIVLLAAAFLAWIVAPFGQVAGGLLLATGAVHLVRLLRWRPGLVIGEPLLLVLHVGYAWLVVAALLMGCAALGLAGIDPPAALHALAIGAIGTMTLGVMSRATLGHTGRALTSDPATTAMFAAITVSALARVAVPFAPDYYDAAIQVSAFSWCLAFGLFVAVYGPILTSEKR